MSDVATTCACGFCDGCLASMDDFLCDSLCEVAEACGDIGAQIKFVVRGEPEVTRDDFQSIKKLDPSSSTTYTICAMNIQYQPNRYRLERAGLVEESEVLIFTPTKGWIDLGVDFRDINIERTTVTMGSEQYRIREKGRAQVVVGLVPLFYTFGLGKV